MKTALITGATGQDGAYLARLLLGKDYQVHATYRHSSSRDFWRLRELGLLDHPRLHLIENDLSETFSAVRLLEACQPGEIYNLAAQTFVGSSFQQPLTTVEINAVGALSMLEAIRTVDRSIRFYQASSAEMFGKVQAVPQSETTPFYPRSPYGVAKLFAHWMAVNYRESFGLFACSGILFNHESPLRGREFVTRRITESVAAMARGGGPLKLGNLEARRDWGYAPEYVEGMWRMLQADAPDSYVLATGRTASVRDFATMAFAATDVEVAWEGEGTDEVGYDRATGRPLVSIDPDLYRPAEVDMLIGDSAKALTALGWSATTSLEDLCAMMVRADTRRADHRAPQETIGAVLDAVADGHIPEQPGSSGSLSA